MSEWRALRPPAPSRVDSARPATLYGVALFLLVVTVVTGALLYSYVYLAVNADEWPLRGAPAPPWAPFLAPPVLSMLAAAAAAWAYHAAARHDRARHTAAALTASVALGLTGAIAMTLALSWEPYDLDEHAYGAVVFVLGALVTGLLALCTLAAAVVIGWVLRGHAGTGVADPPRVVRAMWVTTSAIVSTVVLVLLVGARAW